MFLEIGIFLLVNVAVVHFPQTPLPTSHYEEEITNEQIDVGKNDTDRLHDVPRKVVVDVVVHYQILSAQKSSVVAESPVRFPPCEELHFFNFAFEVLDEAIRHLKEFLESDLVDLELHSMSQQVGDNHVVHIGAADHRLWALGQTVDRVLAELLHYRGTLQTFGSLGVAGLHQGQVVHHAEHFSILFHEERLSTDHCQRCCGVIQIHILVKELDDGVSFFAVVVYIEDKFVRGQLHPAPLDLAEGSLSRCALHHCDVLDLEGCVIQPVQAAVQAESKLNFFQEVSQHSDSSYMIFKIITFY